MWGMDRMKKILMLLVSLLVVGCSSVPFNEKNVSIVIAREVSHEKGATGIADSFIQEGKVYAFVTFSWDPASVSAGNKTVEMRWYAGDKLISTPTHAATFWRSPHYFWFDMGTTALALGENHVDCFVDGVFVGSKTFTITKN